MHGLIMDFQLNLPTILRRAEQLHFDRELVTRLPDKSVHRYTVGEMVPRAKRLAVALKKLGLDDCDRVGTFCWNHYQHLEAYMGIPCAGGVLHTLNLRLHENDLTYIASHAGDSIAIVDDTLWELFDKFRDVGRFQARDRRPHGRRATAARYDRLRRVAGRCRRIGIPLPRHRRAASRGHVLHLGHDRYAQGRVGFAPRHRAALDGQRHDRHLGPQRTRFGDGRRADVPRQRLGHAVHLPADWGEAGLSRTAFGSAQPAGVDGPGARHRHRWRADHLARHAPDSG